MQEESSLEMPACRKELLGVLGEADSVALYPFEHPIGQHDGVTVYLREGRELDHLPAVTERSVRVAEGQDLAPVDVVMVHVLT